MEGNTAFFFVLFYHWIVKIGVDPQSPVLFHATIYLFILFKVHYLAFN